MTEWFNASVLAAEQWVQIPPDTCCFLALHSEPIVESNKMKSTIQFTNVYWDLYIRYLFLVEKVYLSHFHSKFQGGFNVRKRRPIVDIQEAVALLNVIILLSCENA